MTLKIAIAGLGIAGAYLFRLLRKEGFSPDVYETPHKTVCGIHPCAWGTSRGFTELVKEADLDPNDYIIGRFDHILFDDIRVKADFVTFDKPRFVNALSQSSEVRLTPLNPSGYDRIIDATGVARAYLPPIQNDLLMKCIQFKVKSNESNEVKIKLGGVGYAWHFPLGDHVHIGFGSLREDPKNRINGTTLAGWNVNEPICGCRGVVRLSAPNASRPFAVNGSPQIIGVGEAIGCVSPLVGDGIVSGMRSVRILLDNWDDPEGYTEKLLREFSWLDRERKVVDKLAGSRSLSILDAWVLLENSHRRMGMRMGVIDVFRMSRSFI
jgi:flavin-dependent dehydrogenase